MEENKIVDVIGSDEEEEEDPYAILKIVRNPDGSITRPALFPLTPPNSSPSSPVLSKDVPLNKAHATWVRIFRPATTKNPTTTLPIIIYFHGGGFIFLSAATEHFHKSCGDMALQLPAIVVSVDYRLAPEHPLPAAYEDAIDAVRWVRDEANRDSWFDSADFTRCFLMGNSSGGNIVYHAALRALPLQTPRLRIPGLILNEPAFGGERRTDSELKFAHDRVLPLSTSGLKWRLALPAGADRDHEFCNPLTEGTYHDRVGQLPKCLVTGHGQDPLQDWQKEFVNMVKGHGVEVVSVFDDDGYHAVELFDPLKGQELLMYVQDFISSC